MINSVLLWALPAAWTQFELLAPDVEERIEADMRRRFDGSGVTEADVAGLIDLQVESLRDFAADGIVLLAIRAEAGGEPGDPPPGLSLTLALANRPASGAPGPDGPSAGGTDQSLTSQGSSDVAAFVSEATPFVLVDTELSAFTRESRAEVSAPGIEPPLASFQAQVFVLPKDQAGMAVITVTTFKPELEEEARQTARDFANTLCFVSDDDDESSDPVMRRS